MYDFPYMKNLKGHDPNELIYKTETDPQTHIMSLWLLGRRGGGGIIREFGMVMYRLLYLRWITKKDYSIAQGALLNVMWQPAWEGVWERMDTCVCMAQSCSPETITTLLTGYISIQNKKFFKKESGFSQFIQR